MKTHGKPDPFVRVPQSSPVAKHDDDLEAFLDDLVGVEEGAGTFDVNPAPSRRYVAPLVGECDGHRGTPVAGVPGLLGSSYKLGLLVPEGSVVVVLTREALVHAFPQGWASYSSQEFGTPLRGQVVYWPWVDMRAPRDLEPAARRILELHRIHEMGRTVEVACFGGHGRTGTLLAILAALAQGWQGSIVKEFRSRYCQRAVESEEQAVFVPRMVEIVRAMKAEASS